ncbi:MAG: ABC transporter substrate-binding protein [Planctomycetota bacterium]
MHPATRFLFALPALLLVVLGVWLFARGPQAPSGPLLPTVESGAFPRVVELPEGGSLRIEAPPQRVVLANSSAVDMASLLLPPARVAAIPEQAFLFSRLAEDPAGTDGFRGVATFDRFDAETVLSFAPDLVVCDPWAASDTVARLRELDVTVLTLPKVVALADVLESIRVLGLVLGADGAAEAALADLDGRIARLRASASARGRLRAVTYTTSGAGGWTAGAGTTNHELITLAGLENAAAAAGRVDHVRTSFEELYALDPDFVLVGDYRSGMEEGATKSFLQQAPQLAELRAVREGRILTVPARLFSASSQEIVAGAEELAAAVDLWLEEDGS